MRLRNIPSRDQLFNFARVHGHGLFDQNVQSSIERFQGQFRPDVGGHRENDGLDSIVSEQGLALFVNPIYIVGIRKRPGHVLAQVGDSY